VLDTTSAVQVLPQSTFEGRNKGMHTQWKYCLFLETVKGEEAHPPIIIIHSALLEKVLGLSAGVIIDSCFASFVEI